MDSLKQPSNNELDEIMTNYTGMNSWNAELVALHSAHPGFGYGNGVAPKTMGAQIVNFLANNLGVGLDRAQLDILQHHFHQLMPSLSLSRDVIQLVNKTDQKGLKRNRSGGRGRSTLYGFNTLELDRARFGHRIDTTSSTFIEDQEKSMRAMYAAFANEVFEKGHIDPRKPLTNENLVMQPHSINGPAKDHYIFDKRGIPKCPTPEYLAEHPNEFYTNAELEFLVPALTTWIKLHPQS